MDSGYYAACTALMSRTQALDVIANNLANSNSPGYRAQHSMFQSALSSATGETMTPLNRAVNDYGVLGGNRLDLSQGGMQRTGNDLDMAIDSPGFFVVQTPSGRFFTRNGALQISAQGQLITSNGDPVMGEQGPIRVAGGKVSVSDDGTISVGGAVVDKLKIVGFPPGADLASIGNGYYSAPARSEITAANAHVQQGVLESSNVNSIMAAAELIAVQRYAGLMQRALSMFHSEINKAAVEDLPRVSA